MFKTKQPVATTFSYSLLGLVLGIYLQSCWPLSWPLLVVIGVVNMFFVVMMYATPLLFFITGAILYQAQMTQHELLLHHYARQQLSVKAVVHAIESHEEKNYRQTLVLRVEQVKREQDDEYEKASFDVLCYTRKVYPFQIADTLELHGLVIKQPMQTSLAGNGSFAHYLVKEGFLGTFFLTKKSVINLIDRPAWSLKRWWWKQAESLCRRVSAKLSPLARRYYALLFLGNKRYGDLTELRQRFNIWGLAHYLARSGLHIVLFVMMWAFLLAFFPVHLFFKKIILILLVLIYHILSWPSISFLRAMYLFLLMQGGVLLYRQTNFFHLLTLVCLLVLLFNPIQLFFLDFQLSFALTFALAWQGQLA